MKLNFTYFFVLSFHMAIRKFYIIYALCLLFLSESTDLDLHVFTCYMLLVVGTWVLEG